eukprot:scaffold6876_cov109-Isochrysis_galbana.AAC.1
MRRDVPTTTHRPPSCALPLRSTAAAAPVVKRKSMKPRISPLAAGNNLIFWMGPQGRNTCDGT